MTDPTATITEMIIATLLTHVQHQAREIGLLNRALDMVRQSFPGDGIFLVDDGGRGRSYTRIARLGDVPDPIEFAAFARHADAIARAIAEVRSTIEVERDGDGLRWLDPSAMAYAEAVIAAVYAEARR